MFGISQKEKLENLVALFSITYYKIRERYSTLFPDRYRLYRLALTMTNIIVINEMIPRSWIHSNSRLARIRRNNSETNSKMSITREITMRSLNVFSLYQKSWKRALPSDHLTPYVLSAYEYCYSPCCEIASEDWPRELYGHFSERTIDKLKWFIDHIKGFENLVGKYDLLSQLFAFGNWNISNNIQTKIDLKVVDYMNSNFFYLVKNIIDELEIKYREQNPKSLVKVWINEDWQIDPDRSTNLEFRDPLDLTGFRGIKWHTPLTNIKEEFTFKFTFDKEICLNNHIRLRGNQYPLCDAYCRKDNLFYIGNANVKYIYYLFSDNKFVGILSDSETKEDCINLLTTLQIYLGKPNKVVSSDLNTIYEWHSNEGHIFYESPGYLGMFSSEFVIANDLRVKER